jgi:hypothetical protein
MSDPYPRYPSEDDVPPPAASSGGSTPPATPAATGTAQPLGVLTPLTVGFAVLYVLLQLPRYALARGAEATWVADGSVIDLTPYEVLDLVGTLVLLGSFVVTCLWLWRARVNVEVLEPGAGHARGRAWVWAGWLVPVVSLWFPYQVVRDVLRVRWLRRGGARVGWWWASFLLYTGVWSAESQFMPYDDVDPDLVAAVPVLAAVSTGLAVVACVLWVRVVRAVAADQRHLLAARS